MELMSSDHEISDDNEDIVVMNDQNSEEKTSNQVTNNIKPAEGTDISTGNTKRRSFEDIFMGRGSRL
jgi:hypothetical protein